MLQFNTKFLKKRKMGYIVFFIFLSWLLFFSWGMTPISSEYDFIPYQLRIYPGNVGDGNQGLHTSPALLIKNYTHPIISLNPRLIDVDLGWGGDFIVDYNEEKWIMIGQVESTNYAGILVSNFNEGNIIYVSNTLIKFPKLLYKILLWEIKNYSSEINIALMISVPSITTTLEWNNFFQNVSLISQEFTELDLTWNFISSYNLRNEVLKEYDVLILGIFWGDGYDQTIGGWSTVSRSNAIENFVSNGGLLVLPEAGIVTKVFGPFIDLTEMFARGNLGFVMMAPSLSSAVLLIHIKNNIKKLKKKKFMWFLIIAEIIASNFWPVGTAFAQTQLFEIYLTAITFLVSTAFLLTFIPWLILGFYVIYDLQKHQK